MTSTELPMGAERRFGRGAWLTLALALVFVIGPVAQLFWLFAQPSDGWRWDDRGERYVVLDHQVSEPSPLQSGDQLIAIAGTPTIPVFVEPPLPPPPGWSVGGSAHYTVKRDGKQLMLDVPLVRRDPGWMLRYVLVNRTDTAVFAAALNLALAAIIFALRPGATAARLLLLIFAFFSGTSYFFGDTNPGERFTAPVVYWSIVGQGYLWPLWFAMMLHLVLTFPTRSWPLRRWPVLALAITYGVPVLMTLASLVLGSEIPSLVALLGGMLATIIALLAVTVLNLRAARERVVRAQTAWFALGLVLSFGTMILVLGWSFILARQSDPLFAQLYWLWSVTLLPALPLCLGVAITRYRLFDIAIIIRRTLVYSMLTLTLGATYVLSVVALQALFVRLTGQESALAVVASTLGIFALFGPLRAHVQRLIDRRFFRQKYDAQQVLAQFAARAQQEAQLDAVASDLLATVDETLKPTEVRLWLTRR